MTDKERMAVLKLAGYQIHKHRNFIAGNPNYLWDWTNKNKIAHKFYRTRGYAIKAAFHHMTRERHDT